MMRLIKRCRFAGTQYWRFDEDEMHVELDYPRDMSMWRGIGYDIDSAFQYKDGNLQFVTSSVAFPNAARLRLDASSFVI